MQILNHKGVIKHLNADAVIVIRHFYRVVVG
jgi:hypothetical protein